MTSRARVPTHGKPMGYVEVEHGATKGAVVGVNLRRQDGSIVTEADLGGSTTEQPTVAKTLWSLIYKIPANIVGLAAVATNGWFRKDGSTIVARELLGADLPDLADTGVGAALVKITRDAKGRVAGTSDVSAADVPITDAGGLFTATDVEGALQELAAGGGGGGAMTLVGSATVAGSAATSLTISSLDLAADTRYLLYINLGNATGSSATISLFYNGDTTATNYYNQFFQASSATLAGSRANSAGMFDLPASSHAVSSAWLERDQAGYPRSFHQVVRNVPNTIQLVQVAHLRNNTANVTSITLSSSVASALAVGSKLTIYKVA